jgi:UDP-2,3-diacylglucosamine pyrophosphatase LpxH
MRGSSYYQVRLLVDETFCAGAKKLERIDPNHPYYNKISSYQTMASYRAVWESFFHYLREHWKIKDAEFITGDHVAAFIDYKIEYFSSIKYLQKISSAMGKLEFALKKFTLRVYGKAGNYDFSIRQKIIDETRELDLIASNYHNRAYDTPHLLIGSLNESTHRLAATIQYEGGARIEGVGLIKPDQMHGIRFDSITGTDKGVIFTKEKGGKEGDVLVSTTTYNRLLHHFQTNKRFKIDRQKYSYDIRAAAEKMGMIPEGSHGLRWNFCKRRMMEYAKAGYTYEQSLQAVSWEMKHNRASITTHYLL